MRMTRFAIVLAVLVVGTACSQPASTPEDEGAMASAMTPVQRGEFLVGIGGCNDCHTPWAMGPNGPEPDMSRMLSGHPEDVTVEPPTEYPDGWMAMASNTFTAWAGPWGVSYTANLTPDQNTGLGVWTEEMFIQAMREGKHMGTGRPILPPMPWPFIGKLPDDDLRAIFAYLRSIAPISNHVPDPVIAAPPQ